MTVQQRYKFFHSFKNLLCSGLLLSVLNTSAFAADLPANKGPIVVTIKPLYSLVARLTEGIETPVLLMKQLQSPHHYTMRPSERTLLSDARIIIWTGPQLESQFDKIIQQQRTATVITAIQADGIKLLAARIKHDHNQGHRDTGEHPEADSVDPHIWLSTHNAVAISRYIAGTLITIDPEHTAIYENNLQQLISKIRQTADHINVILKNHALPFIAHHDAFQYFEREFGLNYIDSISFDEETGVSLKHLRLIRAEIQQHNVQCLVYQEPKPAIMDALTVNTSIKTRALDPLGLKINDDNNAWFEIMNRLAADFQSCLQP